MKLRTKLLLAQAPLVLALLVVFVVSAWTASRLGARPGVILTENFLSVTACEAMRNILEEADRSIILSVLRAEAATDLPFDRWFQQFERNLEVQEHNITEVGEHEATSKLRERWNELRVTMEALRQPRTPAEAGRLYLEQIGSRLPLLREALDRILVLNHDAMALKSDMAQRTSGRTTSLMFFVSLAACVLGLASAVTLTDRMLRPLGILSQAVRRIGAGDFEARVTLAGADEVAELAKDVNTMVGRLSQYKTSSLGELLEAQQAAQAAIDSLRDPVAVYNLDGAVIIANEAARSLKGLGLEILAPGEPRQLDASLAEVVESVRSHVLSGSGPFLPQDVDQAFPLHSEGTERWLLPHAAPLYGPRGAVKGVTLVLQDVTKLHRFAQFKTDLVATAAHELRTPLTSLQMSIHLCLEGGVGPLTETQLDLLYAARGDCERLQALVEELLQLSRLEGGAVELNRQRVDSAELLNRGVEQHQERAGDAGIKLEPDLLLPQEAVGADPERIGHVLDNLISNAIRNTSTGGRIRVGLRPVDDAVRFEVQDTGRGIPEELQHRVFDRFFQLPGAPPGGTGLGLAIAREIVHEHGGQIGVQSEPGAGATFWFTLPRWNDQQPQHEASPPEAGADAQDPS